MGGLGIRVPVGKDVLPFQHPRIADRADGYSIFRLFLIVQREGIQIRDFIRFQPAVLPAAVGIAVRGKISHRIIDCSLRPGDGHLQSGGITEGNVVADAHHHIDFIPLPHLGLALVMGGIGMAIDIYKSVKQGFAVMINMDSRGGLRFGNPFKIRSNIIGSISWCLPAHHRVFPVQAGMEGHLPRLPGTPLTGNYFSPRIKTDIQLR
ncbi:MAG: hypothetical protein BWY71_02083 [Planctomycetes bacterium ADurb.Bin412]|nr:MAG: hypothetical protein BWY71_02083 [Planctomycetes bacterium ADurb.Bin412]